MTSWRGHPSCVAPCQGETYLCVAIGERCAFLRKLFHWNVARLLTRDDRSCTRSFDSDTTPPFPMKSEIFRFDTIESDLKTSKKISKLED